MFLVIMCVFIYLVMMLWHFVVKVRIPKELSILWNLYRRWVIIQSEAGQLPLVISLTTPVSVS